METIKTAYYKELLKRFDTFIIATKSIKSGNYYTGNVRDFFLYLEANQIEDLNLASESIIKDYYGELATRDKQKGKGKLNYHTINTNLSTLRMLSIRMQKEGILTRALSVPRNLQSNQKSVNGFSLVRTVLTTKEIKAVYEQCENNFERSLIALAYGCGLRRGALVNLKDKDINYQKGILTVVQSKNNKTRQVPISNFFLKPLRDYSIERLQIQSRNNIKSKQFFINEQAIPYSGSLLNKTLKRIIERTNDEVLKNKNITLHCLRHSIATHLMDAGQSYEYVKNFLGHAMIDTTTIYAKRRKVKSYYTI